MPSREKPPDNKTKYRKMSGFGRKLREGKGITQRCIVTRDRQTPKGMTGNWVKDEGGKGRSAP